MRNHQQFYRIIQIVAAILATMVPTSMVKAVNTQIQTDHTLSGIAELSINTSSGNHGRYTLSELNGQISGHNLFYSFSTFNIGATDSALFNLNTPDLANVINRITGGSETIIDGKLSMTNTVGSTPNFYFINPAGITFGAGASVDVPGSFYTSTASKLNFSDGSQYPINETRISTLSSATPESFGFLGNETGSINIGSSTTAPTTLEFKAGTNVAFAANQILINNATVTNADISQAGINLQLTSTGNEIAIIKPDIFADQLPAGNMTIQNSHIEASGNGSGYLAIQSGTLITINSNLFADNTGDSPMSASGGIDLIITSNLTLDNTQITSDALSKGKAGMINIDADSLKLTRNGSISSTSFGVGNAGQVIVKARQIDIQGNEFRTGISSVAEKGSSGHADNVFVVGLGSDLENGIYTNIETLNITSGATIAASTFGAGNAGQVVIHASHLDINGQGSNFLTGITSTAEEGSSGNAGNVFVSVDTLTLTNTAQITSSTSGKGNAGQVVVEARKIDISEQGGITSDAKNSSSGAAGNVFVYGLGSDSDKGIYSNVETLNITSGGVVSTSTFGAGDAGPVVVHASRIDINGQDSNFLTGITSTAEKGSSGNASNVFVYADALTLTNTAQITSSTSGKGNAGQANIQARRIDMTRGGIVTSSTFDEGNAGQVVVNASYIDINGQGSSSLTGIISTAEKGSSGKANNVFIYGLGSDSNEGIYTNVETLNITSGGVVSTSTFGAGDAGAAVVHASRIDINGQGSNFLTGITSTAEESSSGNAGNVFVYADTLTLTNTAQITSSTSDKGNAGQVVVEARQIDISEQGEITSDAKNSSSGAAGNVFVYGLGSDSNKGIYSNVETLNITSGGVVSTSTFGAGDAGQVVVHASRIDINGQGSNFLTGIASTAGENSRGAASNIFVYAGTLKLHEAQITSSTSGEGDAGNIAINFQESLFLDFSKIETNANTAQGGGITINGGEIISLHNSQIATSVLGRFGNGGAIAINDANFLILNTGFIQANTKAIGGSAGNIFIDPATSIVASNETLITSEKNIIDFDTGRNGRTINVIQTAAPNGLSGSTSFTPPQLNLSSLLTNLAIEDFDSRTLNRNMCTVEEGSSLLPSGKGGMRLRAKDFLF